jgi:hypothetical protein
LPGHRVVWTIVVGVVAAVAIAIALIQVNSGTPSKAASSPVPPTVGSSSPRSTQTAPVVMPKTSGAASIAFLSDLHPSGPLSELVNPGPATISGSIYPKSISFYCNVGDPTPFPVYTLPRNARRFQATIGLAPGSPSAFRADLMLIGDGHTLRTFGVGAAKPRTVDVKVNGVHSLKLECFGSGNSYTGGEAVGVEWGNARFSGGR